MKKIGLIAGFVAVSLVSAVGWAYAASDIKLFVNGKQASAAVEIIDGSSYVPLRAVAELLGADVKWDGDKREIRIAQGVPANVSVLKAGDFTFIDPQIKNGKFGWDGSVELRNDSSKDFRSVTFKLTFYDEAGKRIGTANGLLSSIKAGETKTIDLLISDDLTGYKTIKAQIDSSI